MELTECLKISSPKIRFVFPEKNTYLCADYILYLYSLKFNGKGLHLAMTGEPRGFSRVTAGFSSYDGEFRMPLVS